MQLTIKTTKKRQIVDITDTVSSQLSQFDGLVQLFVQHTTAAITTADLDPGTDLDLLDALVAMIPDQKWRHPHNPDHAPDHLLASIIGPALSVPVTNGALQLGTWQRLVLVELDGPRQRQVCITLLKSLQ